MKNRFCCFLILSLLIAGTNSFANPPIEEGKAIFMSRCAACHNLNKVLTGPALAGVDKRRSMDWIISFVHSSQTMVKKGDTTALALFEKFNKIPMPDHTDLSEENIRNIVSYIQSAESPVSEIAPFAKPKVKKPNYLPVGSGHYAALIGYLFVVVGLVAVLYFSVQLRAFQRNRLSPEKQI